MILQVSLRNILVMMSGLKYVGPIISKKTKIQEHNAPSQGMMPKKSLLVSFLKLGSICPWAFCLPIITASFSDATVCFGYSRIIIIIIIIFGLWLWSLLNTRTLEKFDYQFGPR